MYYERKYMGRINDMKYTIGQIFRLGLIKTRDGMPYKDKASVSKWLKARKIKFTVCRLPWGKAKSYEIDKITASQKKQN